MTMRIPVTGLVPFWLMSGIAVLRSLGLAKLPGLTRLGDVPWIVWAGGLAVLLPWLFHSPSRAALPWARLFDPDTTPPLAADEAKAATQAEADAAREASTDAAYAPPAEASEAEPRKAPPAAERQVPHGRAAVWAARVRPLLVQGMLSSIAYLAIVAWPAWPILARVDDVWPRLAGVAGTCLLAAAVLDIVAETRFRRAHRDATSLVAEHRLYAVDAGLAALASAGVPAHARNAGVRALLWFFGPFVPVEILVPAGLAGKARERLSGVLDVAE